MEGTQIHIDGQSYTVEGAPFTLEGAQQIQIAEGGQILTADGQVVSQVSPNQNFGYECTTML